MITRPEWLKVALTARKVPVSGKSGDTGWQDGEIPPRYSYTERTRPAGRGWEWRSFTCSGADAIYRVFFHISPTRGKWKAWLVDLSDDGKAVILRVESQDGADPGLHVHAPCGHASRPKGTEGINGGYRLPDHRRYHRRTGAWTRASFVNAVADMLRIEMRGEQEDLFGND